MCSSDPAVTKSSRTWMMSSMSLRQPQKRTICGGGGGAARCGTVTRCSRRSMPRKRSVCGLDSRNGFARRRPPAAACAGSKSCGMQSESPQRAAANKRAASTSAGETRSCDAGGRSRAGGGASPESECVPRRIASHSASYWSVGASSEPSGRSTRTSCRKSRRGRHLSSARKRVALGWPSIGGCGTTAENFTCRCAANQCRGASVLSSSSCAGEPRSLRSTSSLKKGFCLRSFSVLPNRSMPRGQSWETMTPHSPVSWDRRKTSSSR
mmetsp:Transcript_27800/g.96083  ORF Transcript_27800/g.96083 Transcript_27800/m.96083 type:complete len:267 (+) Transcript_27800:386-1186(+)